MKYPTKPTFYSSRPEEFITQRIKLSEVRLVDGDEFNMSRFNSSSRFYFDIRSVKYEESDGCYLVEFREEKTPNPNYAKELAKYEKEKAEFDQRMAQFHKEEKLFKEEQAKKEMQKERELYEKLKAKFEANG